MMILLALMTIYFIVITIISIAAFRKPKKEVNSKLGGFTFIIPFKDEEHRISILLSSLNENRPKDVNIEFLFIDDHSIDNTVQSIRAVIPEATILTNNGNGKKAAITTALEHAQYATIITLDADAELPAHYFKLLPTIPTANMLVGPVYIQPETTFINALDRLEQLSIQTLASGSLQLKNPLSASGAHLMYQKDDFLSLQGFSGNEHIQSGDDMFLLQKFEDAHYSIQYWNEPNAIVSVLGTKNYRDFFYQKVRWGSKMKNLSSIYPKVLGLLIFSANLAFIIGLFSLNFHQLLFLLIIKWMADLMVYYRGQTFFKDSTLHIWLPLLLVVYPFYQVVIIVMSQVVPTKNWSLKKK